VESQITIETRVKALEVSTHYSQKAIDRIEKSIEQLSHNTQKSIDQLAYKTQKSIDQLACDTQKSIEQLAHHTERSFDRLTHTVDKLADNTQKSVDRLDQSIQHVRQDFDRKFCWLFGLQISTILTLAGILAKMANIY
jgi:exonuclease VII large subunit